MKNAIVILAMALTAAGCARGPIETATDRSPEQQVEQRGTEHLTPLQYEVTQNCGTEPPFQNEFWDHKEPGLYLDIVSGKPLFASMDKFDSGSGWPSFTRPLEADLLVEKADFKLRTPRTEVRSAGADSHLGHVFGDGPGPDGLRYCINSAALRFVHVRDLEREGLGEYLQLFPEELREQASAPRTEFAYLAGGCFWGMEDILRKLDGVVDTEVGYAGAKDDRAEAIRVEFDPEVLTYDALLDVYYRMHDPTTRDRQGNDIGRKYRSALFTTSDAQAAAAEKARDRAAKSGRWSAPIVTEIEPFTDFEAAADFHQDYLVKRPGGYTCHYLRD